jgi:uncharacterized membrane protein HdeD (DUF308 family)
MAHLFGGVLAIFFAVFVLGMGMAIPEMSSRRPLALILGVFCFCNGLFRSIDLAVDRPEAALAEGVDAVLTLLLGIVLFARWRTATPALLSVLAGIELISGGIALSGSTEAWRRHPEEPPYGGRVDQLERAASPLPTPETPWAEPEDRDRSG